ncbi:hypothetical protein ACJX0J_023306, partial [Zea mays]
GKMGDVDSGDNTKDNGWSMFAVREEDSPMSHSWYPNLLQTVSFVGLSLIRGFDLRASQFFRDLQ